MCASSGDWGTVHNVPLFSSNAREASWKSRCCVSCKLRIEQSCFHQVNFNFRRSGSAVRRTDHSAKLPTEEDADHLTVYPRDRIDLQPFVTSQTFEVCCYTIYDTALQDW